MIKTTKQMVSKQAMKAIANYSLTHSKTKTEQITTKRSFKG